MIALIGTIMGLVGSALPALISYFQKKDDYKHELDIMALQIKNTELLGQQKLQEISAEIDKAQMIAIYQPQQLIGNKFMDGFVASVRPVIAYAFFILYAGVKVSNYFVLYHAGADTTWSEALQLIWTENDLAIFCTVLSYYFGGRALQKFSGKK